MQGLIDWFSTNQDLIVTIITGIFTFATVVTGFFNGPKKETALTWIDRVRGWFRIIGLVSYKDEPGTFSVPGAGDTGERN